jgi:hypothetical protein
VRQQPFKTLVGLDDQLLSDRTLSPMSSERSSPSPNRRHWSAEPLPTFLIEGEKDEGLAHEESKDKLCKTEEVDSETDSDDEKVTKEDSESGSEEDEAKRLRMSLEGIQQESAPDDLSKSKEQEAVAEHGESAPMLADRPAELSSARKDGAEKAIAKRNLRKSKAQSSRSKGESTTQGLQNYHDLRKHFESEMAETRRHYDSEIQALKDRLGTLMLLLLWLLLLLMLLMLLLMMLLLLLFLLLLLLCCLFCCVLFHQISYPLEIQETQLQILANILKNTGAGVNLKELVLEETGATAGKDAR